MQPQLMVSEGGAAGSWGYMRRMPAVESSLTTFPVPRMNGWSTGRIWPSGKSAQARAPYSVSRYQKLFASAMNVFDGPNLPQ